MSSRSERRRGDDDDSSRRRSGADSMTSSSRRKSSRRDGHEGDSASFAPTITEEPSEILDRGGNESRKESSYDDARRRSSKSDRNGKDDSRREDLTGVGREHNRRDTRKSSKSSKRESTRAASDHDASLPQNQFPGEVPNTYTAPYRPPGLASEYYGDHGESVHFQPGVRPNQPSIVTNAEQAHLMEPTLEARPPAEPSSLGQVGAAAGYFGSADYDSDSGHQTTPSKVPQTSLGSARPPKHSIYGVSPRSSPGPQVNMPLNRVGAAAEYYTGGNGGSISAYQTPNRPPPGAQGSAPYSAPAGIGNSQHHSNAAMYAGAAALTGAAAGVYVSSHASHPTSTQNAAYTTGHHQQGTQMHHAHRHEHKGLFGRFVDWWRDPAAIAQYEQYTEAIGVCKYCFDPTSTPAEAPRRHNYRRRRTSSGSRYGSTTRVDKTYRYSSDEERRKRSSTTKKVVLGGLAGYGVTKVGESMFKQHHDFDDGHSAKLGRPANQSRVSFQDEPQHERYGDVRLQRRNSDRKSSNTEKASRKDKHRRRRSSSSSSNSSPHGVSRGIVMSTGAAAAGLAVAAAALDKKPRRRSRSRSRSPTSKKKYFSKRVSPMHSYVDLSTTNDGPSGLMGFFTSPSANTKKGKKPKGLFNFANDSSSSSDADLRFGEGTVRRKVSSKRLRTRPARSGDDHSTAAMMGLVAAGTALAAEADRRQENGRRRHDANDYAGRNGRHTSGQRISLNDHESGGRDDEWYDTDGDAESDSSVDTALAYGGGISAAQSRESLAQHQKSSRLSNHNFREDDQRRYHDGLGRSHGPAPLPVSGGSTAAIVGPAAMSGWMASNAIAHDDQLSMGPLPPMQDIEPRPISDPPSKAVSPQVTRTTSTSLPLQQPQLVFPVAPFIEGIDTEPPYTDRHHRQEARQSSGERRRHRRDSSPAKLPTQNQERRWKDNTGAENRRRPGVENVPAESSVKEGDSSKEKTKSRGRRSSETTRSSSDPDQRVVDIERELEKLYEEHRQAQARKGKRDSVVKKVTEGAAIGAVTAVAAIALAGKDGKSGSGDDSTPKRKSSLKKSRERETSPKSETQQERIARMAAQRVRSTPSPVQHDDYSSFFVPAELKDHLKEHNDKAEHSEDMGATVVEIIPGAPKPRKTHPFDPYTYRQFGLELEDDPTLYPWPVPMLGLVEPTPPGSQAHSVRGDETPVIEPKETDPSEDIGEPLERRESKVTWGDHDTYVYEVQTPEYERSSYDPEMEVREPKPADRPSPEELFDEPSPLAEETSPRPNVGRTWTLDESEADKLEKVIPVVDDRPRMSRAWTVDDKEADQIEHKVPAASLSGETRQPETLPDIVEVKPRAQDAPTSSALPDPDELPEAQPQDEGGRIQSYYQSPFAESVSDLGATAGHQSPARPVARRPVTVVEDKEDSVHEQRRIEDEGSDPQVLETLPGPRMSKSGQRRRERAGPSIDSVTPEVERHPADPETESSTPQFPDNDSVFDYLVDQEGEAGPSTSSLGLGATAVLAADLLANSDDQNEHSGSGDAVTTDTLGKPKRSSTYDDSKSTRSHSDSKADYQSDPEDWERSRHKKSKKSKSSSKTDVGTKTSNRSKGQREADEAAFVPLPQSSTVDDFDEDKSSRRSSRYTSKDVDEDSAVSQRSKDEEKKTRSKRSRDADIYRDDDARSTTSSPADSKGKKKESGGFFTNIFSSSKSDVSTSSRKSSKSSKSESRVDREREDREPRKKRKSRDKSDFDDAASAVSEPTRRSRPSSDTPEKASDRREISRDQSLEDGFVSAEETTESRVKDVNDEEPFLGDRLEMPQPTVTNIPMGTDGVSGHLAERESPAQPDLVTSTPIKTSVSATDNDLDASVSPTADQASTGRVQSDSARAIEPGADSHEPSSSTSLPQVVEPRRLSTIRTSDVPSSPISTGSPTAVPLFFRRPPMSPTNPRLSMSSPSAALSSPLTTPRTRQGRPKSTEFRNSKEFRPLYLVERQNFAKTTAPELEEDLPSLPSSRTSSAHPSMEDLRGESQAQEHAEYFPPSRMSAEVFRERGRRHSYSYWHDDSKRRESPDYLDSRSATPVPGEAQRARDQEKKSKPKYEFHSPSELLQDPALLSDVPPVDDADTPQSPLPSVASTDFDQDYMSARSRSLSPTRARSFSRGRRSASTTRSTSASWHDALTTAAAGALAGSALGIAAHGMMTDGDVSGEVTKPWRSEPSQEERGDPRDVSGSATLAQDRNMPAPASLNKYPNSRDVATLQPGTEAKAAPEATPDTGAWQNVFAEIHKRNRGSAPIAASPSTIASEQDDEISRPKGVKDVEQQPLESSTRSKKSKKEAKAAKKKGSTLTLDDTPSTSKDSEVAYEAPLAIVDTPQAAASSNMEGEDTVIENYAEADTREHPTQAVAERSLPTSFDDRQEASLELGNDLPRLDDKITKSQSVVSAESKSVMSPLERAFEAAFRARGLAEGATVEAAYHSFQPEIPDLGGTQLTTIQEESELATPASEQDPPSTAIDALVGRKASKKEKRKQKKSKQVPLDDWTELSSDFAGGSDKLEAEVDKPEGSTELERLLPEDITLAEPTPAEERPNPFGDDFEVKSEGLDLTPATLAGDTVLGTPADEVVPQTVGKKGKKDKKKKKQSYTWEEAPVAESAETEKAAIEPDVQVTPSGMLEETFQPLQAEKALEEDMFATPTETPQQETEDPWELSSMSAKKMKSRSKKKSLPINFDDTPVPEFDKTVPPTTEAGQDLGASLEPDRSKHGVFAEQIVSEPGVDDVATSAQRSPTILPVAGSRGQVESQFATAVLPEKGEVLSPQTVQESTKDQGVENGIPAAAAVPTADQNDAELPESTAGMSEISKAVSAAVTDEDGPAGGVTEMTHASTEDKAALPVPEVSSSKGNDDVERPKAEMSRDYSVSERVDAQAPVDGDATAISTEFLAEADIPPAAQKPLPQQDEDFYPVTKKRSKKDKKKNRTDALDDQDMATSSKEPSLAVEDAPKPDSTLFAEERRDIEVPASSVLADEQIHLPSTLPRDLSPFETPADDTAITSVPTEDTLQQDDFFSVPAKKSKKDKKKKRQSTLAGPETSFSIGTEAAIEDGTIETSVPRVAEIVKEPTLPDTLAPEVVAEAPIEDVPQQQDEDLFPASVKKLKKEKKKKRTSTFVLDEPDEPAPAAEVQASEKDTGDDIVPEDSRGADVPLVADYSDRQPESQPVPADEVPLEDDAFVSTSKSKKAKKEKKKRRTLLSNFEDTPEATLPGQDMQTPTIQSEQVSQSEALVEDSGQPDDSLPLPELVDIVTADGPRVAEPVAIPESAAADLPMDTARELNEISEPQEMEGISGQPVPDHPLDKALAVETQSNEPPAIEPEELDASRAGDLVGEPTAVGTEIVEPSVIEAPVFQSEVERTPILVPHPNDEPGPYAQDDHSIPNVVPPSLSEAVEIPMFEPATVQAPVVKNPADDVTPHEASATLQAPFEVGDAMFDRHGTDTPTAGETPIIEYPPVEQETIEGSTIENPADAHIMPGIPAAEVPSVETPLIETPEVKTPTNEAVPQMPGGFESPAGDDWGFPVKKSKKDKKKKRQSAVVSEPFESESTTTNVDESAVTGPGDVKYTTVSEVAPMEGDADVSAREDVQADWAPMPKSKKDKKKKKRQSTLSGWEEAQGSQDVAKDGGESQPIETESPDAPLGLVTDEPVVRKDADQPSSVAPEVDVSEPQELTEAGPDDEWAFTSANSKKGRKKQKQKRQSTFAGDMVDLDSPAEDVKAKEAIPSTIESQPQHTSEMSRVVTVPMTEESTEVEHDITPDNPAMVDDLGSKDAHEDDWGFTSTKNKKDKKKKKRQSVAESAERAADESPQVQPELGTATQYNSEEAGLVEEHDGVTTVTVPGEQGEIAWAPTVKKKDKKKNRKSKLDEDIKVVGEDNVYRDVTMQEAEDLQPTVEQAVVQIVEPIGNEEKSVEVDKPSITSAGDAEIPTGQPLAEPISTPHPEEATILPPWSSEPNESDNVQEGHSLESKVEGPRVEATQLPLTLPAPEVSSVPEDLAKSEAAGEQDLAMTSNKEVAPGDRTPDYFGFPKKQSKKDKKKKRQATFDEPETTDAFETPMEYTAPVEPLETPSYSTAAVEAYDTTKEIGDMVRTSADTANPVVEEEWAIPSKGKSKKGKKKNRQSGFADLTVDPVADAEVEDSRVPSHLADISMESGSSKETETVALKPSAEMAVDSEDMHSRPATEREIEATSAPVRHSSQTQSAEPESDLLPTQPITAEWVVEPDIFDPADAVVEPLTQAAIDDAWAMPPKKSKKRQSTVDEGGFDHPRPEATEFVVEREVPEPQDAPETTMREAIDENPLSAQPNEQMADGEWALTTKAKKDKKKKRKTLPIEETSQPITPAEEASFEQANMAGFRPDTEATTMPLERLQSNSAPVALVTPEQHAAAFLPDERSLESETFNTVGQAMTTPQQTEPSVAEEEWGFSTKKSKKDKKKKKQYLALGDAEMDDPQSAVPAEQAPLEGYGPEPVINIIANSIDDRGSKPENGKGAPEIMSTESFDMQPTTIEHMAQAPEVTVKEVEGSPTPISSAEVVSMAPPPSTSGRADHELETGSLEAAVKSERTLEPSLEEPVAVAADWPEVKRSKKEKRKSKRQSTFDDSSEVQEPQINAVGLPQVDEATDAPYADEKQLTTPIAPVGTLDVDEWAFSTKKSKKKSKKEKALPTFDDVATPGTETAVSTDQFESAAQTPYERLASPEPMEDIKLTKPRSVEPEAVAEDYFTPAASKKKSKKEKKGKSLLAWGDDVPIEDTSDPVTPALFAGPESSRDLGSTAEAPAEPVVTPRDVLDLSGNGATVPRDDIATASTAVELDDDRHRWFAKTPQQEHNSTIGPRTSGDLEMHDDNIDSISRDLYVPPENSALTAEGASQPARDPSTQSANLETTKRDSEKETHDRKKSKKDRTARKERRNFEFDGTEQVEPAVLDSGEIDTRELDVMETIHEESFGPSPATGPAKEPSFQREFEELSDVSESTRERRRRRRSPPAWSGEEPADLPRDRALTPPPEHDDIMDTALGVAAGLGFGGREPDPPREQSPKPPSPSRQLSTGWSFARLAPGVSVAPESNRDSGVQFESPIFATDHFAPTRDSGFIPSPATAHGEFSASREDSLEMKLRPPRPQSPTSSTEDVSMPQTSRTRHGEPPLLETPNRKPSPVDSTSKDRSSVLFNSSPAVPSPLITTGLSRSPEPSKSPLQRSPSIHGHHHSREELRKQKSRVSPHREDREHLALNLIDQSAAPPINRSVSDVEMPNRPHSPGKYGLGAIREDPREMSPVSHPFSEPPVSLTPQTNADKSAIGAAALAGVAAATVSSRDAGAKSLGRSKSRTSSLRNLRGSSSSPFDPDNIASGPSQEPANARDTGKAAVRDRDMADVYDGYGSYPGSPMSPTRPQSVRRRQSMQQIKDLETRLDQLASENRALVEAKIVAEQHLEQAHFEQNRSENVTAAFDAQLQERDAEIARLKQEVASLVATHASLKQEHEQRLFDMQQDHEQAQTEWHGSSKELETLRARHNELSTGMESIVRHEIDSALAEKNAEIQQLRADLEIAREQVRELQSQILERPADEVVVFHDEDYFDQACQRLCQQVQGWVLRFSKFSDLKLCRSTNEVRDEKIVDRFDNAILDGSDVDNYLADRVKRRDAFMSVVMTMIWEYVFTRYLFGMDRDQRQKLKQLEKNLGEVGPASAVHQWRALTLTLLSKRESFKAQRESDTEAVALEIFSTLSRFLPPPQNLEEQIVGSLRNVMRTAVDLSIEMRTQRAEYIMLPPLQPEYDTNGDLARKVYFNASLMNERSGETTNNEDLEREQAVVRMVLFPLVVKKGDDNGVGDDEIVVCPAQVLIARPDKAKKPKSSTRHASGGSDAKSLRAISTHSLAMSGIEGNENMF
ncbi:hypothetical protein H2200_004229 [Cladophialophora chaetospira]|uniref:Involucrin repeat protein n=1 Tax=Cladophialophora chaetospira TaxID=386627 RepID=A0AA38XFT7_9EURO|nr:hypothetical protein H2200_004229 [Cladophialophora chaetospira]